MKATMKKTAAYLLAMLLVFQMLPALADGLPSAPFSLRNAEYRDKLNISAIVDTLTVGGELKLEVADADKYTNITWTVYPEGIVTVEDGVVTGVSAGTVTITATEDDHNDSVTLRVIDLSTGSTTVKETGEGGTGEGGSGESTSENMIVIINGAKEKTTYKGEEIWLDFVANSSDEGFEAEKVHLKEESHDHLAHGTTCGVYQDELGAEDFYYEGNDNVEFVVSNGWLQIKPAILNIYVNNAEKNEGEDDPVFTAEFDTLLGQDTEETLGLTYQVSEDGQITPVLADDGIIAERYRKGTIMAGTLTVKTKQMVEYPLYNLAKVGNSWYRLRKTTIKVDKPLSEYLQGVTTAGTNVPLNEENYEVADYDFANEILENNNKRYAYISRRNDTDLDVDGYYTATLNKTETLTAVKSKIGAGNAKTNVGNWLIAEEYRYDDPYATDSFHRNYTIVFYDEIALKNQTVYNMLAIGTATDYYKLKTTTINAIPAEKQTTGAVVNPDSYELVPYDFTNLVLEFDNVKYVYSSDGQEDEYTSYYTVDLENVRKEERFNNKENWFTDTTKWLDGASKELFGVTSNKTMGYHANYRATLHKGKERKKSVTIESDWPKGKPAFMGTKITLTAYVEGFEGLEYTLQWQWSEDLTNWNNIDGENGETFTYKLDEKTTRYHWRVAVIE